MESNGGDLRLTRSKNTRHGGGDVTQTSHIRNGITFDNGHVNNGFDNNNNDITISNDEDGDDDWIYDGVGRTEPTCDDIEDDDDDAEHGASRHQHPDVVDEVEAERRSCCDDAGGKCCYGCGKCLRRAVVEGRSACAEFGQCVAGVRLRYPCNRASWTKWARRQFPIAQWLPRYTLKHLRGDVVAGLTTGFSVIPQGLAYGQIVELAPQYGLYSAFMGSFVYAIFGTGKDIAVGPSVIVSVLAATYGTGNAPIKKDPTYAILLALFSGILQAAMGLLRLGFLFEFVSLPVLKAFRAAAGVTIIGTRIKKWWDIPDVPRDFIPQLYWTLKRLPETQNFIDGLRQYSADLTDDNSSSIGLMQFATVFIITFKNLLFGTLSILLLFTFKKLKAYRWKRRFRDMPMWMKVINRLFWILGSQRNILVVVMSSAITYALITNNIPIAHTDIIPPGIPAWRCPNFTLTVPQSNVTIPFSEIAYDIGPGIFFIAFIGMLETISIGKAFGKKGNYKIDYNQELLAIGLSNILCSFVSGHPVTGAFLRSAINFNAGVKTPAAGMLAAAIVLVCLTVATPIMCYIPVFAMSTTILMGGIDVVTFHKCGVVWKTKRSDIIPYLVTFIVSLTWGIQYGVFIGVGVDLMMLLYSSMTPGVQIIPASNDPSVKVIKIEPNCGFLFLAVERMTDKINNGDYTGVRTILMDISQVADVDTTMVQAIRVLREQYKKKDIQLFVYNPQPAVENILNRTALKESILKPSSTGTPPST